MWAEYHQHQWSLKHSKAWAHTQGLMMQMSSLLMINSCRDTWDLKVSSSHSTHYTALHHTTLLYSAPHNTTLLYSASHHLTLLYIAPNYCPVCHTTLYYTIPHHTIRDSAAVWDQSTTIYSHATLTAVLIFWMVCDVARISVCCIQVMWRVLACKRSDEWEHCYQWRELKPQWMEM